MLNSPTYLDIEKGQITLDKSDLKADLRGLTTDWN